MTTYQLNISLLILKGALSYGPACSALHLLYIAKHTDTVLQTRVNF